MLDATDIVRLVGEHVSIKPKGREYVCLCPFHDDRNPSCYVVPHKQIFHCFVCGAGGDAIDFVMKYHAMGFREALELLANRAGIELTPFRPAGRSGAPAPDTHGVSKPDIAAAGELALDFFRTLLRHDQHGAEARATIERRGVSPEMVEAFELGVSPDRWDGLVKTIESRGLDTAPYLAAGLLKTRESGGLYDSFRHRWMFPIRDQVGRVVAFGGRKLREEDEPKYLNSPDTPIFDKSSICYGLHQATETIRATRRAVVVEGYTDVIACHQAGETNVVATMGTALTPKHARILRRLCDEVVLVFDGDDAGQRAADRALEVFFAEPVDVRIAVLPGGADPADLLAQERGVEQWRAAIDTATDALDYRFARLATALSSAGPAARIRAVEDNVASLIELGVDRLSPIRRTLVNRRLAQLAGVDEDAIARAFRARPNRRPAAHADDQPAAEIRSEPQGPAEHLLGALLADPGLRSLLTPEDTARLESACPPGPAGTLAAAALSAEPPAPGLSDIEDPAARAAGVAWSLHVERITDHDPDRLKHHALGCLASLARLSSPPTKPQPADPHQGSDGDDHLAHINTLKARGGNPTALSSSGTTHR